MEGGHAKIRQARHVPLNREAYRVLTQWREQTGVPLNAVRDLLGHASVATSLRYAHLAPDQRCELVAGVRLELTTSA